MNQCRSALSRCCRLCLVNRWHNSRSQTGIKAAYEATRAVRGYQQEDRRAWT